MQYKQTNRAERGFTLVELLVVIGIIAALAAVVIPNVGQFMGRGQQGANDAEGATVQAAIDLFMAEGNAIAENTTATNDFTATGTLPLAPAGDGVFYIRNGTTTCDYTWTDLGEITQICP